MCCWYKFTNLILILLLPIIINGVINDRVNKNLDNSRWVHQSIRINSEPGKAENNTCKPEQREKLLFEECDGQNCCCTHGKYKTKRGCISCGRDFQFTPCKSNCFYDCNRQTNKPIRICNKSEIASPQGERCIPGCKCKPGTFEIKKRTCVKYRNICLIEKQTNQENTTRCPGGMTLTNCMRNSLITCRDHSIRNESLGLLICIPGCECERGKVFDEIKKMCIEPALCDVQVNINALCSANQTYSECNANPECQKRCEDDDDSIKICPRTCVHGCVCKEGYILNSETNQCVHKSDCPSKQCSNNQTYSECDAFPTCQKRCEDDDDSIKICPLICAQGCVCKEGYILNSETNQCIHKSDCPSKQCANNQTYSECDAYPGCQVFCDERIRACPLACYPGCVCKNGYLNDAESDQCVIQSDCPVKQCAANQTYSECNANPICQERCEDDDDSIRICPRICVQGCVCKEGYILNSEKNQCVHKSDCPVKQCTANQTYTECDANSSCQERCEDDDDFPELCYSECVAGCVCNSGYALNAKTNSCILINDCPARINILDHKCNANESYSYCGLLPGCRKKCGDGEEPTVCAAVCYQGCTCNEQYVLDNENNCILESDCPINCSLLNSCKNFNVKNFNDQNCLPLLCTPYLSSEAIYKVKFVSTWSSTTHKFQRIQNQWLNMTGLSHMASYELWENCFTKISRGVQVMSQTGSTAQLKLEYEQNDEIILDSFTSDKIIGNGYTERIVRVNKWYNYVSVISMMGKATGYMVGVDRVDLCSDNRKQWRNRVKVCAELYSLETNSQLNLCPNSKQYSNCSFGYFEFTRMAYPSKEELCNINETFSSRPFKCDRSCELSGGRSIWCRTRVQEPSCICKRGYARNYLHNCIKKEECTTQFGANKKCSLTEWELFAIAHFSNSTKVESEIRFINQPPTGKFISCDNQQQFSISKCQSSNCTDKINLIEVGCSVWIDTCTLTVKCGTVKEYNEQMERIQSTMKQNRNVNNWFHLQNNRMVTLQFNENCSRKLDSGKCSWTLSNGNIF